MAFSTPALTSANWPYHEDLRALRLSALHRLAVAGIVIGCIWYLYLAIGIELVSLRAWSGALVLVASSLVAYWIGERWDLTAAASVLVSGVAGSVLLAAWAYADPMALMMLALAVGVAGLLIGSLAAAIVACAVSLLTAAGGSLFSFLRFSPALAWEISLFAFLMALLLWVAMHPLRRTLHWAWSSYERARQQTEALMEHRAQLSRALKDLDLAYRRLETMAAELERARAAAEEARRLKAEFAANISHELRTPLNLIIGFSEMMALAPHTYADPLPPCYRGDVQAIYRNAQHLSNLIDDVLDLSQIEAGRMGLVREPVSLAKVIAEAAATVSYLFHNKGLSLTINVADDLPTVPADRTRVRQVLINLLNNAARFTDRGGVTITATANDQEVTVAVADTGIGIAPEDLPKVFEEFRQLDASIRRRYGGSGLGLAISRKFVELHGGRMWVTSQVGEGTTFYFTLPLADAIVPTPLPPEWMTWAHVPSARQGERAIVLLDPEPATVRLFERYLDGYRIIPAANEEEARQAASQAMVHAIVVVAPSGEAGWLQLRRAREGLPNLPVIACTLRSGVKMARPAHVKTYLMKPISREQFLAALADLGDEVHSLLIVDDEPEVVRLLCRLVRLAPRPYRVMKAYGGAQALAILQKRRPGAIVLDLLMPEVDGYTVLEHLQADERLRDIPVLIVTAKGQEDEVITAGLMGITRRDGLSIGELMRCLQSGLDALRPPAGGRSVPALSATSPA